MECYQTHERITFLNEVETLPTPLFSDAKDLISYIPYLLRSNLAVSLRDFFQKVTVSFIKEDIFGNYVYSARKLFSRIPLFFLVLFPYIVDKLFHYSISFQWQIYTY